MTLRGKVVPAHDRNVRPGARQQNNVAGAIAIRTCTEPFHPALKIEQVGPRMLVKVIPNRHQLSPIENFKWGRVIPGAGWYSRKDQINRTLEPRERFTPSVCSIEGAQHR